MSDSLRPRVSNIAAVLGVALPILSLGAAIAMAYSDMSVDRATRAYVDTQHTEAIKDMRDDIDAMAGDKEMAREISALRAQVASLTATVEALRDDVKRRRY